VNERSLIIDVAMDKDALKRYAAKINDFYARNRRMPSYSEMLSVFALRSKNAVYKRIERLVSEGFFSKDKLGRLLPLGLQKPVRLLGLVQAGFPSPAEEETVDLISLDEYLISNPQATFLLKVSGDSMIDEGIMPGDLVLVQRNLEPKNGDIVVASVDGEWTLKYFDRKKDKVSLKPANRKYPSIEPRNELTLGGVVIANVRKYK
jgi:repressor LexA